MREFEPEFAGKMNFYLSAVNDLCVIQTTSRVLVLSCARREIGSSPNARYATSTSPSEYLSIGWPRVYQRN
jgi:hypothetical protein